MRICSTDQFPLSWVENALSDTVDLAHFTESEVGHRGRGDLAGIALQAHSPVGFCRLVHTHPQPSPLPCTSSSPFVGLFLEQWQLESPVDCFVRGNPTVAVGVHKGSKAKASGPGKLSKTWQPSCRGVCTLFLPHMESLLPARHPFLHWFGRHLIYVAEIYVFELITRDAI